MGEQDDLLIDQLFKRINLRGEVVGAGILPTEAPREPGGRPRRLRKGAEHADPFALEEKTPEEPSGG
ncbi:MAG: hypothetical protein HQL95_03535 [Magnetococcales bacterium]|nr:hypothetical protein [Magnetococcales bacterium]